MNTSRTLTIGLALTLLTGASLAALATEQLHRIDQHTSEILQRTSEILELQRLESPGDLGNRRLDVRLFIIRDQLSQADHPIVFVGDSITEAARLPSSICGRPVVNAGIGGADVTSYGGSAGIAKDAIQAMDASLIVIALGTNDASAGAKLSTDFRDQYRAFVRTIRKHAPKVVLVGVPPIEEGRLRAYFDLEKAKQIDTVIREIAQDESAEFVDIRAAIKSHPATIDGVHLWADSYRPWLGAITDAVKRSLQCTEVAAH